MNAIVFGALRAPPRTVIGPSSPPSCSPPPCRLEDEVDIFPALICRHLRVPTNQYGGMDRGLDGRAAHQLLRVPTFLYINGHRSAVERPQSSRAVALIEALLPSAARTMAPRRGRDGRSLNRPERSCRPGPFTVRAWVDSTLVHWPSAIWSCRSETGSIGEIMDACLCSGPAMFRRCRLSAPPSVRRGTAKATLSGRSPTARGGRTTCRRRRVRIRRLTPQHYPCPACNVAHRLMDQCRSSVIDGPGVQAARVGHIALRPSPRLLRDVRTIERKAPTSHRLCARERPVGRFKHARDQTATPASLDGVRAGQANPVRG